MDDVSQEELDRREEEFAKLESGELTEHDQIQIVLDLIDRERERQGIK